MKIDLGSFMFNMNIKDGGATPSWGTALGQGTGYKIKLDNFSNFSEAFIYNAVDVKKVWCPLGKGGNKQEDFEYKSAALFNKVYINGDLLPGTKFVLLIVKELSSTHAGRLSLKYSNKIKYEDIEINKVFFDDVIKKYNIDKDSACFISEINISNQDELHFKFHISKDSGSETFSDISSRKRRMEELMDDDYDNKVVSCSPDLNIKGLAKNLIISGTPGCGKSYYLQNKILKSYNQNNVIRTTFFQDYSNTDFVGQILPTIKTEDGKDIVEYVFNPGPFSLALYKAITNPNENVALVIEELNRGNAASIFGDLFQLLDRNDSGISQYPITNVNIQKWLNKEISTGFTEIKIPGNLSIYATMNTSDQNVFTLDSAFKRRWNYEKLQNVFNDHPYATAEIPDLETTWKNLVEHINNEILTNDEFLNSEDKQLGVYFIDEKGVKNLTVNEYKEQARKEFAHKLFGYLWDDVAKFHRKEWFGEVKSLDELIYNYLNGKGTEVFKNGIFKKDK